SDFDPAAPRTSGPRFGADRCRRARPPGRHLRARAWLEWFGRDQDRGGRASLQSIHRRDVAWQVKRDFIATKARDKSRTPRSLRSGPALTMMCGTKPPAPRRWGAIEPLEVSI